MRLLGRLRRAHHGMAYFIATVLVVMALVGLAAGWILPLAERHPDRIAAWLSDRAGRNIRFDKVDTSWTRRGPLLKLENLHVGDGRNAIRIGDAEMLVSQYAGLLPGRSFTELRVRGLDLTLERQANGRWKVHGLPGQQGTGDPLASLQRLGELQVIGARLRVLAPAMDIDTRIPQVHVRLQVDGDRVRAGIRAWMRNGGVPVDAAVDFNRKQGDGRAWLGTQRADLAQWSALLRFAGVGVQSGSGRAQAWLKVRARQVAGVSADLALQQVVLRGKPETPGVAPPEARLERLRGKPRWTMTDDGWRVDAPLLEFGDGENAPRVQRLALAGGRSYAAAVDRLDAGPLVAIAALSDRLQPGLRAWLQDAKPVATLNQVQAVGGRDGRIRISGRVHGFGFAPAGDAPGLRGLAADVQGDRDGISIRFDPASAIDVDWPRGFGVTHRISLDGSVAGWREAAGWRTETAALRVRGSGYGAALRGGLLFQGDGTRPRIELAADVDDAQVTTAKRFWIRHSMPAAAMQWLDTALVSGHVRNGQAVVSGDLDDWPFAQRAGVFHATARIDNATIKFQPGWPAAERMNADVDFIADGFAVRGHSTSIAGVGVTGFDGAIEHFGHAVLTVNANAASDASRLLGLLRQSPLQQTHAETLANIEASGDARVTFSLLQPMHPGAPPATMKGTVALRGARLAEKRWDLAFTDVTGEARYGSGGFATDGLAVVHRQQAGKLALRAGDGFVRDSRQAFEAELDARLRAEDLLQRAPELDWLRPKVSGVSPWTIAMAMPKAGASQAGPSHLQLRSNLVGTTLLLPAPLDKPSTTALATVVDIDLPLGEGEVAVAFGNRLALRARSRSGQTGVRVALGASRVDAPPPASGLIASGRSERLDAIEWAALTRSGASRAGNPSAQGNSGLALRSVDITVAALQLIGSTFPDTRVRAVPAAGGTGVRLDGRALSGALLLPQADTAPIAGKLDRLHWRATNAGKRSAAATPASDDDIDPAKIPSLNLAVDDLRFGGAVLGKATLRTQRTAAGMRITQLQTRAPKQAIDVTGEWTRVAGRARSRFDARLQSEDFGALLGGFGFGKQVAQGKGSVRLQAQWPGSPALFKLANLSGQMNVDVRDGQLIEIEPGAGRVLGLLSITQLPRRLAFDFRDFFNKGFAFNTIQGDVSLSGGNARTQNLSIDGPAAEIRIRGAANMRAQTYDQTVDVFPRTGNLLTVAGAIAGGPVGAAIGAAANAVLKKPLGQLGAKSYRITGPWKDPNVETTERGQAATAPAEPPG